MQAKQNPRLVEPTLAYFDVVNYFFIFTWPLYTNVINEPIFTERVAPFIKRSRDLYHFISSEQASVKQLYLLRSLCDTLVFYMTGMLQKMRYLFRISQTVITGMEGTLDMLDTDPIWGGKSTDKEVEHE